MHSLFNEFMDIIQTENREEALKFVIEKLDKKEIDIVTLYNELLAPSLNIMVENENDMAFIWREHVRSSIIRTIIENSYPYVVKERDEKYGIKREKKVAVVCPIEEYHELGARMITDFFILLGYEAVFVGSNTPKEQFYQALKIVDFDYIAISVTNPYNLVAARKSIVKIREASPKAKILVGGNAFKVRPNVVEDIGADMYLSSFDDIKKLSGGSNNETSI